MTEPTLPSLGDKAKLLAALDAWTDVLRADLNATMAEKLRVDGALGTTTVPGGIKLQPSFTRGGMVITDPAAWMAWVRRNYPTEMETVPAVDRVRSNWAAAFFIAQIKSGNPTMTSDGEVIPGVEYRVGGDLISTSVLVDPVVKTALAANAFDVITGYAALPMLEGPPNGT